MPMYAMIPTTGQYKAHPKVYVGFFKHPNFADKDDSLLTEDLLPSQRASEYRSDDWYYISTADDLISGSVIGRILSLSFYKMLQVN